MVQNGAKCFVIQSFCFNFADDFKQTDNNQRRWTAKEPEYHSPRCMAAAMIIYILM
jgi:hypothetical protein